MSGAVHLHSRGVFLRDQIVELGASRAQISLAFSVATAAGALFAPVLGYLLDRYPIRRVMMAGVIWMSAGFLLLTQVSTLVTFAVLTTVFVGLGTGTIGTTANSKLMVSWFDRRRGLALSVAIMGYSLAGVVMAPVAVMMLEELGWRGSYGVFSAVLLLGALPLIACLVRVPASPPRVVEERLDMRAQPDRPATSGAASTLAAFRSVARSGPFWMAVLVFGSMSAVFGGLNLHLFLHFTDIGIGPMQAASALSMQGALALASKPVTGWVIDRYGEKRATSVAAVSCLVALLVLLGAESFVGVLIAGAALGLAFGSVIPLQAAMLSRLFNVQTFARAYGSFRLATFPLVVTCPLLIGYVHDLTGGYAAAFAIFALLFFGVSIAVWRVQVAGAAESVAR